mgnify:CR=1 FL=1|tara:strand:- start:6161 stop:7024 length:864 start_codon:yes stop_codon:yes gene_type:complete
MALKNFTNLDNYYEDSSQFGEYQYTTLETIVNNFMFEQDDDSYVSNSDRGRVAIFGKKGVRELYYDVVNEIISLEMDLDPSLIIALPHDYIQYVRISWVDQRGKKHPLAYDNSFNLAQAYLQDDDYSFLYDQDGDILKGSHIQNTVENNPIIANEDTDLVTNFVQRGFNVDRSKIFKNGSFVIDKTQGVIQFSSSVTGRTIVLDYLSDGLFQRTDSEIKIHKFAEEALYAFIYFSLIKRKRSVPEREKQRAEADWYNQRRLAKKRITPINYDNIRQILKGSSKWIKD